MRHDLVPGQLYVYSNEHMTSFIVVLSFVDRGDGVNELTYHCILISKASDKKASGTSMFMWRSSEDIMWLDGYELLSEGDR